MSYFKVPLGFVMHLHQERYMGVGLIKKKACASLWLIMTAVGAIICEISRFKIRTYETRSSSRDFGVSRE